MDKQRMEELISNFIEHLTECNSNIEDTLLTLKHGIGMKEEEWKELGWDLTPDDEYIEIEFFEGDEGDLDAEDYVEENDIEDYEIEWDDYRKGYSLRVPKED